MRMALVLLVLALGCISIAPAEIAKEQRYAFYFKSPAGEGTVNIAANGDIAEVTLGDALLKFNRTNGALANYRSKTSAGYIGLRFLNNSVSEFEQGYASGKATYYYGKNGTRVVYFSQDKTTESYLNFTPKQEALTGTLLEAARTYSSFFARPDQRYRTGNRIIAGFDCDTYESGTETSRREVCYSEKTGAAMLDVTYSRLDGAETEAARVELRSYLEG